MELLSPAKNIEIGIAAINSGADAIYIGGSDFGARKSAANSISDLEKLINYAHFYKVKVYITINTILYDNELEEVEKLIKQLYEIGADALIIQDMSILQMNIPPIELHASTQTHNYDIERINFLDKLGFKRIVLARECSFNQISEIQKNINAEIECFVHGALCVSFSGQCYMSARIGKRSANRGECSQACRMKYSLINDKNKILINNQYLLSLRDLSLSNRIKTLIELGVNSLKIEGRLKDIVYVSNTTAYYRQLIDKFTDYQQKNSSGIIEYDYEPNIYKTFNRGFTEYFFDKPQSMANFSTPKSIGEKIGKVLKINGNKITIDTNQKLNNGDGFCFETRDGFHGLRAQTTENNVINVSTLDKSLKIGYEIYRNLDTAFVKKVENSKTSRKIRIKQQLSSKDGLLTLKTTDEDNITSEEIIIFDFQIATNQKKSIESIKNSLSKTGEQFLLTNLEIDEPIPFLPNSIINNLRRNALETHKNIRINAFAAKDSPLPSNKIDFPQSNCDYKLNVSNKLAKQFYENHSCKITQPAFELLKNTNKLEVMTTKYCIRRQTGNCTKINNQNPDYKSEYFVLKGEYQDFIIKFDCKNCMMHIYAK